jgi:hypothetical protein
MRSRSCCRRRRHRRRRGHQRHLRRLPPCSGAAATATATATARAVRGIVFRAGPPSPPVPAAVSRTRAAAATTATCRRALAPAVPAVLLAPVPPPVAPVWLPVEIELPPACAGARCPEFRCLRRHHHWRLRRPNEPVAVPARQRFRQRRQRLVGRQRRRRLRHGSPVSDSLPLSRRRNSLRCADAAGRSTARHTARAD